MTHEEVEIAAKEYKVSVAENEGCTDIELAFIKGAEWFEKKFSEEIAQIVDKDVSVMLKGINRELIKMVR